MPIFSLEKIEENLPQENLIMPVAPVNRPACPNCGTVISCGCEWVDASDGKRVCESCVTPYEESLVQNKNN